MTTVRWRLTLSLWAALVVVGAGSALFVYLRAERETQSLLDYQLTQVARLAAARSIDASVPTMGPGVAPGSDREEDTLVIVRDATGRVLYCNAPDRSALQAPRPGFSELRLAGEGYRVFGLETHALRVTVAQSLDVQQEAVLGVTLAALLPVVLLIPLLAVVIGVVIPRALAPLERVVRTIAERPPLALESLPVAGLPQDLRPVIDEINHLLARLRAAMEREREFLADAAHALRTPIAALQLQAGVLEGCTDPVERAARVAELRAGTRRVARLADHLLVLARDPAPGSAGEQRTSLGAVLQEAYATYGPVAALRGVTLDIASELECELHGDLRQLLLLVGNLVENAIRYTPAGGAVRVRARAASDGAALEIVDEGPGLPPQELERVFERFYRAATSDEGGSGLGLATVRAVAEELGGRVVLENRADRTGLIARVTLVAAAPGRPAAAA